MDAAQQNHDIAMSFYEIFTARGMAKEADVALAWANDNSARATYLMAAIEAAESDSDLDDLAISTLNGLDNIGNVVGHDFAVAFKKTFKQESLEVEATALNKDTGFVRPGQPVTLKVESFPYTRYGYLEGIVETVSHDAAQDEQLGLVFPARVRLQRGDLMVDGVKVGLTPGMSLSAEIKTGKRRLIDYVFSPLQKQHGSEAFRER